MDLITCIPSLEPPSVIPIMSVRTHLNNEATYGYINQEARIVEIYLPVTVKVKKLTPTAMIPEYQTSGAAGMDLHADIELPLVLQPRQAVLISSGISIEIPPGFEAQVRSRSGLALKQNITVLNSPGTIDSDYRGKIGAILFNHGDTQQTINPGDRIAQLVFCPVAKAHLEVVEELSDTDRGSGGFGSTGKT